jgi:hypothetical protein
LGKPVSHQQKKALEELLYMRRPTKRNRLAMKTVSK